MTSGRDEHRHDDADRVLLYALGALPPQEARSTATHILGCVECRLAMEALRPTIDALSAWPLDDVLRPSAGLWDQVAQRIGGDTGAASTSAAVPQWTEPEWKEVAPGIRCKLLARATEDGRISMLVRLAPGTDYPPHRHGGVEELHMLDGELIVDGKTFYPGDYRRAELGTVDRRVWSQTGCTCVLITSCRDVML